MVYARGSMSETTSHDFRYLPLPTAGLAHVFARPKVVAGLCVVMLTGLGWAYFALLLGETDGFLRALCSPLQAESRSIRGIAVVTSMWSAMTLAMMLPSAAPMILAYAEIADTAARKAERIVSPFVLTAGYVTVWFGFSIMAALTQIAFMRTASSDPGLQYSSGLLSGAVFIGAGAYQFSTLKHACLTQCQRPFPFFFANWATTRAGVFRLGLRQGSYCLGCCWAMMLVTFVVGSMNVIWMAALGIVMTIEKMLTGRSFSYAIGTGLIVLGAGAIFAAFGANWPMGPN
jgi:predicted metal-binding membrane protein